MRQLIKYQRDDRLSDEGPACSERGVLGNRRAPWDLLAWTGRDEAEAVMREASPKAPPIPPYRGVAAHTDQDFDLIRIANIAKLAALAPGSGEACVLIGAKGVWG